MNQPADSIAIAHRVFPHEDFDHTAHILLKLLRNAQSKFPGAKRSLYLDIDGHRNSTGHFDHDMLDLQSKFMTEFLLQFLTRAVTPLAEFENPQPQNNAIPEELNLVRVDPPPTPGRSGQPPSNPRF
jgi:hypothetical protein